MFDEIKTLINFINLKIGQYYTGQFKISFEKGELSYINLTTKTGDIPKSSNIQGLKERFEKIPKEQFYGTIQFNLENGIMTGYLESQTFQGGTSANAFMQRELRKAENANLS